MTIRALGLNRDVARQIHQRAWFAWRPRAQLRRRAADPSTRLVRLAREGVRYSPQFLQRFGPERRYATLVAFLLETSASLTDQTLELHDRSSGSTTARPKQAHSEHFQQSGRAINEKVRLYASVGVALITAREAAPERLARPAAFDPLALLDSPFPRLRRYAPTLLDSFQFHGTSACQPLLDGLALLKELNASERLKKVPATAPIDFVSPRWEPHVVSETGGIDRRFYELCALSTLRDRLRAGDVWVAGSRQ